MVRKGKLNLMNSRLPGPRPAAAVYDSSLDQSLPKTVATLRSTNYDFDKILRRDQLKEPDVYHTNEIVDPPSRTRRGEAVSFQQQISESNMKSYVKERPSNTYENLFNDTAEIYRTARQSDTTISIKKGQDVHESISARVKKNEVPGTPFGKSTTDRPDLYFMATELGPGDYNITEWESGRCGLNRKALKFSGEKSDRIDISYVNEPSPTTYFQGCIDAAPRPATTGSVTFSNADRFIDTNPPYVKDTGLLLDHDFDRERTWKSRGSYRIKVQTNPRTKSREMSDLGVDFINTDSGNKITFKTAVQKNKYRYAPCFKSNSEVGLTIPTPASGDIGPDHYRGVYKSSLNCIDPKNKSSSFRTRRNSDVTQIGEQYKSLKPRLGKFSLKRNIPGNGR